MSKSGTYVFTNGKWMKASDKIPSLKHVFGMHFDDTYYDPNVGRIIRTKQEKKEAYDAANLIPYDPQNFTGRPKQTPEQRLREIEQTVNRHLTDKGVEGIKLRDLHKQRKEKPWESRPQQEVREAVELANRGPA